MKLSRLKHTPASWLTKIAFLVVMVAIVPKVQADIIENTEKQLKQNALNIKNDIKELQNQLGSFQNTEYSGAIQNLKEELGKAANNFKSYDGDKIEKAISALENGDEQAKKLAKMARKTVNDIRNIATVVFTAPVGMSGGYGQTGLKIMMDTLTHTRAGANSAVKIDTKAEFQLPFSIAKDGENTIIKFEGGINLLGESSAKLNASVENTGSANDGMAHYPILDRKAEIAVSKESYVEVDCNGFRGMRLKGEFRFSNDVIYKDKAGPTKEDSMMTAEFDITITDLEDIIIETGFKNPFKIKCTGDIVYTVTGLVADLSTVRNADGFQFPRGYDPPFKGEDEAMWTGFGLKMIEVDVSEEIPFAEKISAYNMLIDETGISGWFGAKFDKQEYDTPVIGVAIDSVAIGIASNAVAGGALCGDLDLKMLKKDNEDTKVKLNGTFYSDSNKDLCYAIDCTLGNGEYQLPFLDNDNGKATVNVSEGTSISYRKERNYKYDRNAPESKEYKRGFLFNLNGTLGLQYSFVEVKDLQFQNLKFSTCEPYFGGGNFALNSAKGTSLCGLEISLNNVFAGLNVTEGEKYEGPKTTATIGAKVGLRLIGDGKGVSVNGTFRCGSERLMGKWSASYFSVDKVEVDADFSAFHLYGLIEQYGARKEEKESLYGKGFKGELQLTLDMLNIDVKSTAQFGKTKYTVKNIEKDNKLIDPLNNKKEVGKEYKYWYVYAGADGLNILMFPPAVMLDGVSLGLFSHMGYMRDIKTQQVKRNYYPDATMAFGTQAGISFYLAQRSLVGGDVKLGLDINSNGGVRDVNLEGAIYMLGKDIDNALLKGGFATDYNFEKDIFKFNAKAGMAVSYLKGNIGLDLLSAPDEWHFFAGTYQNPAGLQFAKIINTNTYFMMGHGIPTTLRPLDSRITELFGVTQSTASGKSEELQSGQGLAFGVGLKADCGFSGFVYAGVTVLGGIDVLALRLGDMNCEGNRYRGYGHAYVYADISAGVKPRKKKFEFIDFAGAADLDAEFPKPLYFHGNIAFRYRVLCGLFKGTVRTKFKAGKSCKPEKADENEEFVEPVFSLDEGQDLNTLIEWDSDEDASDKEISATEQQATQAERNSNERE